MGEETNGTVKTDLQLDSSRTGAVTESAPRKAIMADVLRVAGSFAGHDRAQTQTQASIALGAGQKTGAGMGAVPTEPEVRKRCGGILALKPARVLPGAEAEQIRKRPPLRPMDPTGSGGDLNIYAPAFRLLQGGLRSSGGRCGRTSIQEYWFGPRCPGSSCPYHAASQSESSSESSGTTSGAARGAGSGWRALGRVVSLGAETGPGSSEDPGCPGSGAAPDDAAPLPVPGYGIGQVFGIATGCALELSGGGAGAASEVSALTSTVALAGDGAIALGGGSLATGAARRTNRPGGGFRIGSLETAAGAPSYQLSRPRAVADASIQRRIRSDDGNDANAD